jgi:hypothetical protein
MKTNQDKKNQILKTIDKMEAQSKHLKQYLNIVYSDSHNIDHEREFVKICNDIQITIKEAVAHTGYYKDLQDARRNVYAPEELEGDVSSLSDLVNVEMTKIQEEIAEGNEAKPINEPNITKRQWMESQEKHKARYEKDYNDWAEFFADEKNQDNQFVTMPKQTNIIRDDKIINAAKGFMLSPVGLFRNSLVSAETQQFDTLSEMQIFLINVQSRTKDMVLYMTFEQGGKYYFRGTFVDKR